MGQLPCGHKLGKSNCGRGKTDVVARRPSCLPIVPSRKSGPAWPSDPGRPNRDESDCCVTAPPVAPPKSKRQSHLSRGYRKLFNSQENLERAKGFEPSTPTLARSCSTPELHPHPRSWRRWVRRQRAELCQMRPMNATTVERWNRRLARTACQRLGKAPKKPEIKLATSVRPRSPARARQARGAIEIPTSTAT